MCFTGGFGCRPSWLGGFVDPVAGQTTEALAGALARRGAEEMSAGRVNDALATFGKVVSQFDAHTDPAVLSHVADALENKVRLLADTGGSGEAIEAVDAYVTAW
jgi:hypothetical protein